MKPLRLFSSLVVASLPLALWGAPALKEVKDDLPPPTAAQFRLAANNLKQIGLCCHAYYDVNNALPMNVVDKEGKPLLSWRVHMLPYLEQDALYREFKLDEPWDSTHNKALIEKIPPTFVPVRGKAKKGETFLQMYAGKGTMLPGTKIGFAKVTDGLSNTFMVVEAAKPVIWTKPDDIVYDPKSPNAVGGQFPDDFCACFGDGAVRRLPKALDEETFRRLIEISDGNVIDLDAAIKKAKESK
jgi:Protein of unknown function (DUF1559)